MMKIIDSVSQWQHERQQLRDKTLGFVPTQGHLHAGHLALIQRSVRENDTTIVSVFVNPTQFNSSCDYQNYPRTLERDINLIKQAQADYLFLPTYEVLYPDNYTYQIHETEISVTMEGKCRPGHFKGMLTIVMKLLLLVRPHQAYFGEKDYQQLQLVKGLVNAFFLSVNIVGVPTVREPAGLPYSSRNSCLTHEQYQQACVFSNVLHKAISLEETKKQLIAEGLHVDYVEEDRLRRYAAVQIGDTRLIDNLPLKATLR